ncbi:MAG: tRNA lysidine(34) synthetase TilS [Syntrophobacterales bacterium]|nr:tRNA lysidine(34) synthetase TilS [Syntrophobacterales bacterium]
MSHPDDVSPGFLEDPAAVGDLPEWVLAYARRERLFTPGDRVLVAVSGGPDSVALLHLLVRLRFALALRLGVAHYDHGLRGAASRGDAEFVADLARRLDLPCHAGAGEVKAAAQRDRVSLQMAARKLRQQFLHDTRRHHAYAKIALGHTADDQVELFWLRVLRGAGLEGLKGMWPATPEGLVRPLLAVGKAVLLAWLDQESLPFRVDASNLNRAYRRTRVRLDLLPHLTRHFNPRLAQTIWRTQTLLQDEERLLSRDAAAAWIRVSRKLAADCYAMDLEGLLDLEPAQQRRVLRLGVAGLGTDLTLTAPQVASLLALARSARSGGTISLAEDIRVARAGAVLHIFKALPDPSREATLLPEGPGEVLSPPGWRWRLVRRARVGEDSIPPPNAAWLDPARLTGPLEARHWRPGDRFWPQGSPGPKKLQDFLVDSKIPRWLRPHLPLVAQGGEIVWAPGLRLAEMVKLLPASREVLEITLTPTNPDTARIREILAGMRG